MNTMKNVASFLIPIFLLIALSSPGQSFLSAETQDVQDNQDSALSQFQPIPVTEIASATTNTLNQINQSEHQRLSEEEINRTVNQSDALILEIDLFINDSVLWDFEGISTRELEYLGNRSDIYLNHLAATQKRFSKHSEKSEILVKELLTTRNRWQYTLEYASEDEIPESLQKRIINTINILDSVRREFQSDIEIILLQLDKFSDKEMKLEFMKERISSEKRLTGGKLFTRDMPGLFKEFSSLNASALVHKHLTGITESMKADLQLFSVEYGLRMLFIVVLFVFLLLLSLWFQNNYSKVISLKLFVLSDIHLKIIGTPFFVVVFITTLIIRFIFPELPVTFRVLNVVINVFSILIITNRIFDHLGKILVRWLMVILLFIVVFEFIVYPDIIQRIVLLTISITSFGLLLWIILRGAARGEIKNGFVYKLFLSFLIGLLIFLSASIIGNILGFVRMAEFFTLATTEIIFLAVAIKVGIIIVDSLVFQLLASNGFQKLNIIREEFLIVYKKSIRVINLLLWFFYMVYALNILRIKDAIFKWGNEILTEGWKIGELDISLRSLLLFLFIIWLSVFISRTLRHILEKDVFARISTSQGMPTTIYMIIRIIIISGGFFLAIAAAGMKLTNISIIIGAFSVGIGFGLQNIFNNMVSGLILAFERPLKVGDTVQVDDLVGVVLSIGFRASKIHRVDGAEVIVPNGNLVSNQMINWTLSDSLRRIDIRVGVAYGSDPEIVVGIIQKAAETHDRILKRPSPRAYFRSFGDSSLNFRLLAWVDIIHRLEVESELNMAINSELKA